MSEGVEYPYLSVEKGKLFVHNETGLLLREVAFYLSAEAADGNPFDKAYWESSIGFNYPALHHGKFMKGLSKTKYTRFGKPMTSPYELPMASKWRVEILWATPDQRSHHHVQHLVVDD